MLFYVVCCIFALLGYIDPQISSYEIFEDRSDQELPLELEAYNSQFFFGFIGHDNLPVRLPPRIGSLNVFNVDSHFQEDGSIEKTYKKVPTVEVDLASN